MSCNHVYALSLDRFVLRYTINSARIHVNNEVVVYNLHGWKKSTLKVVFPG